MDLGIDLPSALKNIGYTVAMHDFFIDRIVRLGGISPDGLLSSMKGKIEAGGGSIRGIEQVEMKGGNAVNLAYALAMLDARCKLVTVADDYGRMMLRHTFTGLSNVDLILLNGKQGYTVSLEFVDGSRVANVMLSDLGDNAYFGADRLEGLEGVLSNAACIAVVNWTSNMKGTELAEKAFSTSSRALHFIDPADLGGRGKEFADAILEGRFRLDVLSMNENEARIVANTLELEPLPYNYSMDDVARLCRGIASTLAIRVDLHTPICSATSDGKDHEEVRAFKVDPRIATGAGDVWDAADILGYLCKMDDHTRLLFANASAAYYVKNAIAPTLDDVLSLVSSMGNE
ncbi:MULTISPECIES: carbohydrate kinase family protein [Candidatus Nitrosocaldus]|uniref:PfkB family carbohydrate kinase n=1 Tax=Candidatus Nitrosocaldus cavascurensis TaxID=2058097 RepID=A0A2K5ANZ0_9ARCH|nr:MULTISPECIES: PfkB family carbohydrate kinase [Candidatus Nitrosocaldus]SPC33352.1 pfkB family carbohydrate kinase [Candidatus Nitrosocaldus cavascurensis]